MESTTVFLTIFPSVGLRMLIQVFPGKDAMALGCCCYIFFLLLSTLVFFLIHFVIFSGGGEGPHVCEHCLTFSAWPRVTRLFVSPAGRGFAAFPLPSGWKLKTFAGRLLSFVCIWCQGPHARSRGHWAACFRTFVLVEF